MDRCPTCIKGKLVKSGSHLFCDTCTYSQFVITQEYLDASVDMLAVLVSNTKFPTVKDVARTILHHIELHLPKLDDHLTNIISGKAEYISGLIDNVEQQAINLQIGKDVLNGQDAEQQLRCQCGSEDFHMVSAGKLLCKACGAGYEYNEPSGLYLPIFLCECGCAAYEKEDDSNMVTCHGCGAIYLHDEVNDIFRGIKSNDSGRKG